MSQSLSSMQSRSVMSVADELQTYLDAGFHITAMIDPLADSELVTTFFNESPELPYQVLFLATPLEHVLEVSPHLVGIKSIQDHFCQYLFEHYGGWGFFAVSSAPLVESIQHWKSLLQIFSDNTVTHFRFYDREVLFSLWSALNQDDITDILGPHFCLFLPPELSEDNNVEATDNRWTRLPHPAAATPYEVSEHYELRDAPWWLLTTAHWAAFEDKRPGIIANNAKEFLFEMFPAQAGAKHAKINLDEFCLAQLQRANALGIQEETAINYFIACCLLYNEQFPDGTNIEISTAMIQKGSLSNTLRVLCETVVNNGK